MGSGVVTQKFAALVLVERRFAPIPNSKIQQVLHSTFGYVQDDKCLHKTNESPRRKPFRQERCYMNRASIVRTSGAARQVRL
jgi:hypothetical protein